jgi:hypothetical protein
MANPLISRPLASRSWLRGEVRSSRSSTERAAFSAIIAE